jgi:hypothetical protein
LNTSSLEKTKALQIVVRFQYFGLVRRLVEDADCVQLDHFAFYSGCKSQFLFLCSPNLIYFLLMMRKVGIPLLLSCPISCAVAHIFVPRFAKLPRLRLFSEFKLFKVLFKR